MCHGLFPDRALGPWHLGTIRGLVCDYRRALEEEISWVRACLGSLGDLSL
jgi:hypothetical protein